MKKKNGKVVKYHKPLKINIGTIVFGIILLYLVFNIFFYLTKRHISVYEVQQGTIVTNHVYRGLILRSEEIVTSASNGHVNYYLKDASKAGVKTPVYSLSNSGDINSQIEETKKSQNIFGKEDFLEIDDTVQSYTDSYDNQNFYSVYSFKDEISARIMEIQNMNTLDMLGDQIDHNAFQIYTASKPGVVVYYTDGYENATVDTLTEELFDENKYKKVNLKNQETVGANVPVYKLITDENWNVVFRISENLAKTLQDDDTVEVRLEDGNSIWAYYDIFSIGNSKYLNLKLRTSMVRFANQRFMDVELLLDDAAGLKIPNSAITEKQFLTIPKEYFVRGKDSSTYGLLISEEGKKDSFVTPEIFYEKDDMYYVDESDVAKDTHIKKPDSNEVYTVNRKAKLKGVYSVDKGYALFKQIEVLYQNEEYSVLKKGTSYGLSLYDHIALEGDSVSENDLIH